MVASKTLLVLLLVLVVVLVLLVVVVHILPSCRVLEIAGSVSGIAELPDDDDQQPNPEDCSPADLGEVQPLPALPES